MRGAEKPLIVTRDYVHVQDQPFVVQMKADVKQGLMSGVKYSNFTFTFDKSDYSFGETIKMKVDCNNMDNSIDVQELKFKIYLCSQQFNRNLFSA